MQYWCYGGLLCSIKWNYINTGASDFTCHSTVCLKVYPIFLIIIITITIIIIIIIITIIVSFVAILFSSFPMVIWSWKAACLWCHRNDFVWSSPAGTATSAQSLLSSCSYYIYSWFCYWCFSGPPKMIFWHICPLLLTWVNFKLSRDK